MKPPAFYLFVIDWRIQSKKRPTVPKNSPVYEKKEPTVIEIGSDQWNILEAYLGSCQGSKIERFTKFVSELKNLNGFAKNSILYVLPEAKYFNLLYKFNLL